jgi:hypothetical protein
MISKVTENNGIQANQKEPSGRADGPWIEKAASGEAGFDKPAVASLGLGTISRMSCEELVRVIQGADLPLINRRNRQRLIHLDRTALERLAHLARRCCRNQGY